ncbi:hypothetical protein MKK75_30505 [Methylobacterium sp. J-030]|uniref:hypothetical protein n=1 Tax=Methylobacterium sp. J-030 TaxID=2836627 RepID=UPI001FBBC042|nr:hypothetical protein [Methylobacterium sp. J-030]MCJ2073077.1 hypothetical protein [Methylobacterium sp. J-030]
MTGRARSSPHGRHCNLATRPLPGAIGPWQRVTPIRPATAHSRSLRFLDATSELLPAVAINGWRMVLTGLATLL